MGCTPARVTAVATTATGDVDMSTMATLDYADGRRAQMSCAMNTASHRHATIAGSAGVIQTGYPNHTGDGAGTDPSGYLPGVIEVRKGTAGTIPFEAVTSPGGSGFRFAAEALARIVREGDTGAQLMAASASLGVAATMAAIYESIRSGSSAYVA